MPLKHRFIIFHMQDSGQYSINTEEASSMQLHVQDSGQYSINTEEASSLQLKLSIKRLT